VKIRRRAPPHGRVGSKEREEFVPSEGEEMTALIVIGFLGHARLIGKRKGSERGVGLPGESTQG